MKTILASRSTLIVTIGSAAALAVALFVVLNAKGDETATATPAEIVDSIVVHAAGDALDPAQAAAIDDRVVTRDEYDAAADATADCARAAGVDLKVTKRPGRFSTTFSFAAGGSVESGEVKRAALEDCKATYFRAADLIWATQARPTADEDRVWREHLSACLRGGGVGNVSDVVTDEDLVRVMGASNPGRERDMNLTFACAAKVDSELGYPGTAIGSF